MKFDYNNIFQFSTCMGLFTSSYNILDKKIQFHLIGITYNFLRRCSGQVLLKIVHIDTICIIMPQKFLGDAEKYKTNHVLFFTKCVCLIAPRTKTICSKGFNFSHASGHLQEPTPYILLALHKYS